MGTIDISDQELKKIVQQVVSRLLSSADVGSSPQAGSCTETQESRGDNVVSKTVIPAPSEQIAATCGLDTGNCAGCGACVTRRPDEAEKIVQLGAERLGFTKCDNSVPCHNLAPFIDHTLLKPEARDEDVEQLCKDALEYGFTAVCVNSAYVPMCAGILKGSNVKVATVVGFPLGAMSTESKAFETRDAVSRGADEIDMVINIGKLKTGDYQYVLNDIAAVVKAAQGRVVKVIIEAASLEYEDKIVACIIAKAAGADYVKTSTGFGQGGATAEDVALMRSVVGPRMGVKAAGGIRDCEKAVQMVQAGATRIGASASVAIVNPDE